jgi:hypothetical protein
VTLPRKTIDMKRFEQGICGDGSDKLVYQEHGFITVVLFQQ